MKRLVLVLGLVLVVTIFLMGSGKSPTPSLEGYKWSDPHGHFKVMIPNDFPEPKEIEALASNPQIDVYITNNPSGVQLIIWWEAKSVHNFSSLLDRVRWNINFFKEQYKGGAPLSRTKVYKNGRYWIQKNQDTSVLFYIRKDKRGNFVGYEYWKPLSQGEIENIAELLRYLSSFEF